MARKRRDNSPVVTRVSPQVKALFVGLAASQGVTLSDVLRDALVIGAKQMAVRLDGAQAVQDGG